MIGHVIARQPFNRRCISGWRSSRHDGDLIPSGHPLIQYRDGSVHRLEPEQLVRLMDDAEQLGDFLGAQPAGLPEVKSGQLFKGDLFAEFSFDNGEAASRRMAKHVVHIDVDGFCNRHYSCIIPSIGRESTQLIRLLSRRMERSPLRKEILLWFGCFASSSIRFSSGFWVTVYIWAGPAARILSTSSLPVKKRIRSSSSATPCPPNFCRSSLSEVWGVSVSAISFARARLRILFLIFVSIRAAPSLPHTPSAY